MKKFVFVSLLLIVFGSFLALSLSGSTNAGTAFCKASDKTCCSQASTSDKCVIKCQGGEGTWVTTCKGDKTCLSFCGDEGEKRICIKKGDSNQGFLGVYLDDLDQEIAEKKGFSGTDGVLITGIVDDSPADEAGLEKGDIVIEAGGEKMEDYDDFEEMIESTGAGNELSIKVFRDGEEKTFTATLDKDEEVVWSWGGEKFLPGKVKIGKGIHFLGGDDRGHLGLYVQDLNDQLEEYFKVEHGVLITEVIEDRPGEKAGLLAGDVIVSLADKDVEDEEELFDILGDTEPDDVIKVGYVRNGKQKNVEVTLDNPYIPNYGYLGVKFEEMNDQLKDYFDVKHGVLITEVIEDSPAEKAGMKAGDVVIQFGDEKIKDNDDLVDAVHEGKPGDRVEITLIREKREMKVQAELERAKHKGWDFNIFGVGEDDHSCIIKLDELDELKDLQDELKDMRIDVNIDDELEDINIEVEDMQDEVRAQAEEVAQKMAQMEIQKRIQDRIQAAIHENLKLEQLQEQLQQMQQELQRKIEEQRQSETL